MTNVNPGLNRGTISTKLERELEALKKEVEELRARVLWLEERT